VREVKFITRVHGCAQLIIENNEKHFYRCVKDTLSTVEHGAVRETRLFEVHVVPKLNGSTSMHCELLLLQD
jgi:hypothetical protein